MAALHTHTGLIRKLHYNLKLEYKMKPRQIIEELRSMNLEPKDNILFVGPDKGYANPLILGKFASFGNTDLENTLSVYLDTPQAPKGHFGFFDHPAYVWGMTHLCILPSRPKNEEDKGKYLYLQNPIHVLNCSGHVETLTEFPKPTRTFYTMVLNYGIDSVYAKEKIPEFIKSLNHGKALIKGLGSILD
ncbi:hypothetical protein GOV14_01770 [Candidatus Pacearchaeota archaeon]|nr:hypothetical protein [Candidatus Pacearchaeota archaeon]